MNLSRSALYSTVASTATRLLLDRDKSPNRTGAYIRARHQAETIALRNLALIDAKRKSLTPDPAFIDCMSDVPGTVYPHDLHARLEGAPDESSVTSLATP